MKIEDIIENMSKSYLDRIVKSFTDDIYTQDEKGYRRQISSNIEFLSDQATIKERLKKHLNNNRDPYQFSLLMHFVFKALLRHNDFKATQKEIVDSVRNEEDEIIQKSKSPESFKHIEDRSLELFETLLEAALDDDKITEDELHLIRKVRRKLAIQEIDQYHIQAKLNHFPQEDNAIHNSDQINQVLIDLQKCGVLFFCNRAKEPFFVLPEEIVPGVKSYLGVELVGDKFKELLDVLTTTELRDVLGLLKLRQSGIKEEIISRILVAGIKPSEVLDSLNSSRLSEICKKLPDVNSSGTKDNKISRIIKYFDDLINIEVDDTENRKVLYYQLFEQLARKDMANLIGKKVVKHEREVELAFEEATSYIFEEKFNHEVLRQDGSEHSDGCVLFGNNGDLLLWDNKTKMIDKYEFPNGHLRQFKRYIRDFDRHGKRVSCFLIIVPAFAESAKLNAEKLKYESGSDTDVSIISAENLKWLAEKWSKNNDEKPFNLEVFNMTGLLTKEAIKSRLKLFN